MPGRDPTAIEGQRPQHAQVHDDTVGPNPARVKHRDISVISKRRPAISS
jgi:hypothetical protein